MAKRTYYTTVRIRALLDAAPRTGCVEASHQVLRSLTLLGWVRRNEYGNHVLTPLGKDKRRHIHALARRYREGASSTELGADYGVSATTVCTWLDLMGVPKRSKGSPRALSEEQEKEAAAAYLEGASLAQVAGKFGISASTAFNVMVRQRVKRRPPSRRSPKS